VLDRDCRKYTLSRRFAVLSVEVPGLLYWCKAEFKRRNAVLKARGIMKSLRWLAILAVLMLCTSASFADSASPNDGKVGVVAGTKSTPITSLAQALTFSPCAGATGDVASECAAFTAGEPQEVFGGLNETGYAINELTVILTGYSLSSDPSLGCDGGTVFSSCTITPGAGNTLDVQFFQGTGTGIGCFGAGNPDNVACAINSATAIKNNLNPENPVLPWDNPFGCSSFVPGSVCGSDDFVIGVGIDGLPFNTPLAEYAVLGVNGTPVSAPEPPTLVLFGVGSLLAMLIFGIKVRRLGLIV